MQYTNRRRFDYDRRLLPNPRLVELEAGVDSIEEAQRRTYYTIGYPGWNLLYYSLLCSLKPAHFNRIIETGTNWGCSTIILAQALKDSGFEGEVWSVDLSGENLGVARQNIEQAGLGALVRLYEMDSLEFFRTCGLGPESVRFAFLDSAHLKDHVVSEFEALLPLLEPDAMVYFDNTAVNHWSTEPRVNEALREIAARFGGNMINFENVSWEPPGQAIWQRNSFSPR